MCTFKHSAISYVLVFDTIHWYMHYIHDAWSHKKCMVHGHVAKVQWVEC